MPVRASHTSSALISTPKILMQVHHRKYNPKLTCSYLHTSYLKHTKRFVLLPSTSEEDEAQGMSIS